MMPRIRSIVIAGGGSAGWMTAAALSSLLEPKDVAITVVESEEIGTVGVGEATIPDIINFNRMLGVNEAEFMKETHATFKLGIEFIDWARPGDSYIHPFSEHGATMKGIDFHQFWLHLRAAGEVPPIQAYNLCAVAAAENKFSHPVPDPRSALSSLRYAYHFDAALYAKFLRKYAEARGVQRVEGKIEHVVQLPESGAISGLKLVDGRQIDGDLFFDCTGFRALLIEKTLGVSFADWRHWLPCDAAQAIPCEHAGPLSPFTRATARSAGWQWRIPTQWRTGNGHIYSREFMNDDEAASVLFRNLDGRATADPRLIRFTPGRRQTFWVKNCIAIGLAAGFLEPLESTSIYLIQEGISRFIALFPDATLPDVIRDEYNRHMRQEFEQVRDFVILHYCATERTDSPFWNYCRTMSIPDSLRYKIDLFRAAGRIFRYEDELFAKSSWVAVLLGQGMTPARYDPIVAALPPAEVRRSLESMRMAINDSVSSMPGHAEYIGRYCAANPPVAAGQRK
jgi:tryptophan halogenase